MKRKDIIYLVLAVVILVVAGFLAYGQLNHGSATTQKTQTVEQVPQLSGSMNNDLVQQLGDPTKLFDFAPPIDLTTGLNNPAPFGPF